MTANEMAVKRDRRIFEKTDNMISSMVRWRGASLPMCRRRGAGSNAALVPGARRGARVGHRPIGMPPV